jgi:hypothetical protein
MYGLIKKDNIKMNCLVVHKYLVNNLGGWMISDHFGAIFAEREVIKQLRIIPLRYAQRQQRQQEHTTGTYSADAQAQAREKPAFNRTRTYCHILVTLLLYGIKSILAEVIFTLILTKKGKTCEAVRAGINLYSNYGK